MGRTQDCSELVQVLRPGNDNSTTDDGNWFQFTRLLVRFSDSCYSGGHLSAMLFNNNMSIQTANTESTHRSTTRAPFQFFFWPRGSRGNHFDRRCCPIIIVIGMLKSQGRRNLTTVHGQQNFDHTNQPSSFQRMTNVGLYASKEKPSLRQSAIRKCETSIGQISQCFQLGRISQLSAGRMRLHVVDVQHC